MREVRGEGRNGGREEVCDLIKTGTAEQIREGKKKSKREKKTMRAMCLK